LSIPEIPIPSIVWGWIGKAAAKLVSRMKIEITFEKSESNPHIWVVFDIVHIRYFLTLRTHGFPKVAPNVLFTEAKNFGRSIKSTVSPSNLGEINGSMRLRLFKNELPVKSEVPINVDFEIKIGNVELIKMDFSESHTVLDNNHRSLKVLCTNNCDFVLEQVYVTVIKDANLRINKLMVSILEKSSHRVVSEVDQEAIRTGDDSVKWVTRLGHHESLLFKVVAS
jgi:hypothetical protein